MVTMPRPMIDGGNSRVSPFDGAASLMAARIAGAVAQAPRFGAESQAPSTEARIPSVFKDVARTKLPIEFQGREVMLEAHAYEDDSASSQAMAVVHRTNAIRDELPLVRMHSGCVTGDIFHSLRCDCYAQLQLSLERVVNASTGCIIYLPYHEGRGIGLVNKIKAYAAQDRGLDTVDANLSIGAPVDARDYELPAKILKDLGFLDVRLMTNNPLKMDALRAQGINVVEQVKTVTEPSRHNRYYLETKRERMAHRL